jgi:hypothetical protein
VYVTLGPLKSINRVFDSSTDDPAEIFGSVLQNDVEKFDAMLSTFSTKIMAHLK